MNSERQWDQSLQQEVRIETGAANTNQNLQVLIPTYFGSVYHFVLFFQSRD